MHRCERKADLSQHLTLVKTEFILIPSYLMILAAEWQVKSNVQFFPFSGNIQTLDLKFEKISGFFSFR